jgi:predicted RNA-binding Zn-ribbon protein involved in translation (DUF1610 family)
MRLLRRAAGAKQQYGPQPQQGPVGRGAWYADPFGTAAERWWDGRQWTQEVRGAPSLGATQARAARRRISHVDNATSTAGKAEIAPGESRSRVCPDCRGTGRSLAGGYQCPACGGKGRMTPDERRIYLVMIAIFIALMIVLYVLPILQHL